MCEGLEGGGGGGGIGRGAEGVPGLSVACLPCPLKWLRSLYIDCVSTVSVRVYVQVFTDCAQTRIT